MNNIVIRFATREDINQVARLHVESWCSTYKGIINQDYLDNMFLGTPSKNILKIEKHS